MLGIALSLALLSQDTFVVDGEYVQALRPDEFAVPLRERVLFFTAGWCTACKGAELEFEPWLARGGWRVGASESSHVQVVDSDRRQDLVARYKITQLPTFVFVRDGREVRRSGYAGRDTVVKLWPQPQPKQQPHSQVVDEPGSSPTPLSEVTRAIARLPRPEVGFVEFGCGSDARWCVAAVDRWGCRATGVEIDHGRATAAREHVAKLGLSHLITIIEGDAVTVDVDADVGAAYLYADALESLSPRIQKLRAFASYMHQPPGVYSTSHGDVWIYDSHVKSAPRATWGGYSYSGPLCNNPRCVMCNSIRAQLAGAGRQ